MRGFPSLFPSELISGCQTIRSFPTETVRASSSVHPRMPPRDLSQWARTLSRHFYALFYITANLYQSVAGEGGTKIIFTSSPNGHPSLRHPLMDYSHGQSSSTPGPAHPQPRQSGRRRGTELLPLFWKFLDALRLGPGKLTTFYSSSVLPASGSVPDSVRFPCAHPGWPRGPRPTPIAVAPGRIPEPAPHPVRGERPAAGGANLSIRRRSPPSSPPRSGPS